MAKYVLEVVSRIGEKVNVVTGSPADSIAVYSDKELRQLHVTVRRA